MISRMKREIFKQGLHRFSIFARVPRVSTRNFSYHDLKILELHNGLKILAK